MPNILIADDEADIRLLLKKYLGKKGYDTVLAANGADAVKALREQEIDLMLCDFRLPDNTGVEILEKVKILSPQTPVIIITGYSDVRVAVEAVRKGAYNYVTKPLYPDEILFDIEAALSAAKKKQEAPATTTSPSSATPTRVKPTISSSQKKHIWGESPQSALVQKHIGLIAPTDMSVIVQGETGTGKEFAARAIHDQSLRAKEPFVAIDCGALPRELAGSELFGHVKGAFTGAVQDKPGCFEQADGGTLFLDEIGNLTYENQVKLLRVLQEREVKRLGATKSKKVDVRVIVATNENLKEAIQSGDFREDLYHRLNEFSVELRPLRERQEDIMVYVRHFMEEANQQLNKAVDAVEPEAERLLTQYYWHGNLRELRNVVKRAILLSPDHTLLTHALPQELALGGDGDGSLMVPNGVQPKTLKEVVAQAERMAILNTLQQTNNNRSKAAEVLEVDRKTLYNKMRSFGLLE